MNQTRRFPLHRIAAFIAVSLSVLANSAFADQPAPFRFESVPSIEAMQGFIRTTFPPGSEKAAVQKAFVDEAGGSYRKHPRSSGTEKYIYDINLCRRYIWRWNISADYDDSGHLTQAYVNGEPVHASGTQLRDGKALAATGRAKIFKVSRPRPEADKGEKALAYIMLDGDGDARTLNDQLVMGGGPTKPGVPDMGAVHVYANVELWRSIFDPDAADRIVDFAGTCPN